MPPGDPDALEALAGQLDSSSADIGQLAADTYQVTSGIRDQAAWTGQASAAYTAMTSNLSTGVGRASSPLSQIAGSVRTYAAVLRDAQQTVGEANSAQQAAEMGFGDPADAAAAQQAMQYASEAEARLAAAGRTAAAAVRAANSELASIFGPDGPVRDWLERIHFPWDALGADAILGHYMRLAKAPGEWAEEFKELQGDWDEELSGIMRGFIGRSASSEDLLAGISSYANKLDAADAFTSQWLDETQGLRSALPAMRGVGAGMSALAIAGDVYTVIKPEDSGVMGNVDRGVAAANGVAAGADLTATAFELAAGTALIPGVGEAVIGGVAVATGLYLAGDWAYHNIKPFHDFANDVGHTTVSVAKDIGHGISSGFKKVTGWL